MEERKFRSGYVSIIGKPNVGKSTLLNAFLKEKLSIVTPKPQTTRHRILGILTQENFQIVFSDTPGIVSPKYRLQKEMVKLSYQALKDSDVALILVEIKGIDEDLEVILEKRDYFPKYTFLVINKIDLIRKDEILPLIDRAKERYNFHQIVPISALLNDGVSLLLDLIVEVLPEKEPFYPEDTFTIHPERFFVSEIIREKIFNLYGEEIPYFTTVFIEEFKERENRKDYIKAVIYVDRDSQKKILIGKKGESLKKVGSLARAEIEDFLGREIYLELWVKVKKNWRKDINILKKLGY